MIDSFRIEEGKSASDMLNTLMVKRAMLLGNNKFFRTKDQATKHFKVETEYMSGSNTPFQTMSLNDDAGKTKAKLNKIPPFAYFLHEQFDLEPKKDLGLDAYKTRLEMETKKNIVCPTAIMGLFVSGQCAFAAAFDQKSGAKTTIKEKAKTAADKLCSATRSKLSKDDRNAIRKCTLQSKMHYRPLDEYATEHAARVTEDKNNCTHLQALKDLQKKIKRSAQRKRRSVWWWNKEACRDLSARSMDLSPIFRTLSVFG